MRDCLGILLMSVMTSFLLSSISSVVKANTDCDIVDVAVILPGSNDVTDAEFNDLKRTVLLLIRGMSISKSHTRLAAVNYGSLVGSSSTYLLGDRWILGSSVMKMAKVGGSNEVWRGLEMARLLLTNLKRYEVPRVALLIYKNVSTPMIKKAQDQADKMADEGIRVISIGIGSSVLSQLAWTQELVFNFTSTESFLSAFREIPKYICKAIQAPNQQSKIAEFSTTMSSLDENQNIIAEYTEIPEICKSAKWVNGVGYTAVDGDVGAFAMCYRGLFNVMKVSFKECPSGQHWSNEDITCVRFTGETTSHEPNSICQLLPVHGSPNKFKQRTSFGLWKAFTCPVGTIYNNDTCGCSTFKISDYMAKQHQDSNRCSPELYLPFCGDLKDFSGKETYIQEIGHVKLREGKAYFDGKSYLFIPRFTGIKYGETVIIKLKYLAEDEEEYVNIDDVSPVLKQFSLISNGVCHGGRCEALSSIFIGGKKGATIFNVSAGDNFASYHYISSEHIRHKRQVSEDIDERESLQEELVKIHEEPTAASMNYEENNLSPYEPIGEGDSEEIRDDEPQIYEVELPDRIPVSESGAQQQLEASQFMPNLRSFVTNTIDNDYDIILEPNNIINIQIPTTTVPSSFTEKEETSKSKIKLKNTENDTKKNDQEDIEKSNIADNEDTTNENFDIILSSSDTTDITKLINEIKGPNTLKKSDVKKSKFAAVKDSELEEVQENVNYDILIDNSSEDIGDLLSRIRINKDKDSDYVKIGKYLSSETDLLIRNNTSHSEENHAAINYLIKNAGDPNASAETTPQTDLGVDPISEISKDRLEATDFDLILNDTSSLNLNMIDTSEEENLVENKINMTSLEVEEYDKSAEIRDNLTSLEVNDYDASTETSNDVTLLKVAEEDASNEMGNDITSLDVDEYTSKETNYNNTSSEVYEYDTSTETNYKITLSEVNEYDTSTETSYNITSMEVNEHDTSTETNHNITSLEVNEDDTSTETNYNITSLEVNEYVTSTEMIKRDNVTSIEKDDTSTERDASVTESEVDEYDTSKEMKDNVTLFEESGNYTDKSNPNDDSSIKSENTEAKSKKRGIWRSVKLEIKDGVIQASVDGRKEDERYFSGKIRTTSTGFYIGAGAGGQNFKGYMDEVYIYFCDPEEETADEKNRKLLNERRLRQSTDRKQNFMYPACDFVNPRVHEWS